MNIMKLTVSLIIVEHFVYHCWNFPKGQIELRYLKQSCIIFYLCVPPHLACIPVPFPDTQEEDSQVQAPSLTP